MEKVVTSGSRPDRLGNELDSKLDVTALWSRENKAFGDMTVSLGIGLCP